MPTLYTLTSTSALSNLRLDLSDTDNTNYRWVDASLNRAIDKAVERYSWASPRFQAKQIPTVTGMCIYPDPSGAGYIDRVEYPANRWPKNFPPFLERKSPLIIDPTLPTPVPAVSLGAGGALSIGSYKWAYTLTVPGGGETLPTTLFPSSGLVAGLNQAATLTGIPVGPYGVSGRNVYRTTAGGATLLLAGSIPDNLTGTFKDTTSDASLGAAAPGSNTTQNLDQFEMQIPPELYPADTTTYYIEVTWAGKHQLDTAGTSIPERHWDVLFYGSVAYAMQNYLPSVNDNFEWADGHLRDRTDDTKSAIAWRVQCQMAMQAFDDLLKQIKEEAITGITGTTHWGDKPLRWERL